MPVFPEIVDCNSLSAAATGMQRFSFIEADDYPLPPMFLIQEDREKDRNHGAEILALMDTADFAEMHELKAECVAAFLLGDEQDHLLVEDRIFQGARLLLRSESLEVAWPTVRFLCKACRWQGIRLARDENKFHEDMAATTSWVHPAVSEMLDEVVKRQHENSTQDMHYLMGGGHWSSHVLFAEEPVEVARPWQRVLGSGVHRRV